MAKSRAVKIGDKIPEKIVSRPTSADRMAQLVRESYCHFYRMYAKKPQYGKELIPKWDGGFDASTGNTYKKPVWPALVAFFVNQEIEPTDYIRLQFAESPPNRLPFPNQLHGDVCVKRWREYSQHGVARLRMRVAADFNALALVYTPLARILHWPEVEAIEYAVRDTMCDASPLIRYILANEHGLENVKELLELSAVSQYAFESTLYSEVLGSRIPANIRTKASALRNIFS